MKEINKTLKAKKDIKKLTKSLDFKIYYFIYSFILKIKLFKKKYIWKK